jgi:ubiquinone/menaquinone biosynthesis C-methylase UbiE
LTCSGILQSPEKIKPVHHLAFDAVAGDYDLSFSNSPIGKLQRKRVHSFLEKTIPGFPVSILEINCGTGEDAIWLAGKFHQVTATDQSAEMIHILSQKIKAHHFEDLVTAKISAFENLSQDLAPQSFDIIFSDFGGLNCISKEELQKLKTDLSSLLKPGGKLIAVFMGKKCLWERFYFIVKGNFREAYRRNTNNAVEVKLDGATQQTWYYSPVEIRRLFSSDFHVRKQRPSGLFIPPSYLNKFFSNKRYLLNLLGGLEVIFSISFLSDYADHFYIEMQKID